MTFEKLKNRVPDATEGEWTQHANGGGWKHITAAVPESCWIAPTAIVGYGCTLGDGCTLGYGCTLGDRCTLGYRCKLGDGCTLGDDCNRALYIQPSNGHAITVGGEGYIQIGCKRHTADWWVSHYAEVGAEEGYTDAQINEYGWLIGMTVKWLARSDAREKGGGE